MFRHAVDDDDLTWSVPNLSLQTGRMWKRLRFRVWMDILNSDDGVTFKCDRSGDSVLSLILPQAKVRDFDQKKERVIQKRKLLKGGNEPHTVISPLKCVNSSNNFRRN